MSRILPHPLLSAGLVLTWLLLNAPLTPGAVLTALCVGIAVPNVMRALRPAPVRVRAPMTIVRLGLLVFYDLVRSNLDVARIIVGRHPGQRRAGFVTVPLEMRSSFALSVLAIILTGTPGTLWIQYDSHTGHLLIHVLDFTDGDAWIRRIKDRYERPLMEIFP